jgi:hypothetical protein
LSQVFVIVACQGFHPRAGDHRGNSPIAARSEKHHTAVVMAERVPSRANSVAPEATPRLGVTESWIQKRSSSMVMSSVSRSEHAEGSVAKSIEQQTAKLPSDLFLWAAIGSIAASATLHLTGNKNGSVFVGQWAPTFLILGLYNKLVKQLGSDPTDTRARP